LPLVDILFGDMGKLLHPPLFWADKTDYLEASHIIISCWCSRTSD